MLRSLRLLLALSLLPFLGNAQPNNGGPTPTNPTLPGAPLDGGAGLLLASGAAYAVRRLRQRRTKAN